MNLNTKRIITLLTVFLVLALSTQMVFAAGNPMKGKPAGTEWLSPSKAPDLNSLPGARIIGRDHATPAATSSVEPLIASLQPVAPLNQPTRIVEPICPWVAPVTADGLEASPEYWDNYYEWEEFSHYSATNQYIDWTARLKGAVRLDNRLNPNPSTLSYSQSESGTHGMSVTFSRSVTASIRAWLVNVSATVGLNTTENWSWTSSSQVQSSMSVPGGKVGYIYSYNPAVVTTGNAVYHVWRTYWDPCYGYSNTYYWGTQSYPISASVPTTGYHSFVNVVADY